MNQFDAFGSPWWIWFAGVAITGLPWLLKPSYKHGQDSGTRPRRCWVNLLTVLSSVFLLLFHVRLGFIFFGALRAPKTYNFWHQFWSFLWFFIFHRSQHFSEDWINFLCRRHLNCLGSRDCGSRTLRDSPKHRTWSVPESPMIPPRQFRPSRAPSGSKSAKSKLPSSGTRILPTRGFRT